MGLADGQEIIKNQSKILQKTKQLCFTDFEIDFSRSDSTIKCIVILHFAL